MRAQTGGDTVAFSRLVSLHQSAVRGFALRLCRDPALADDLAQDAFLLAYRKIDNFRGSGSFASWVLGITYRCFLQSRREHRRAEEVQQSLALSTPEIAACHEPLTPAALDLERAIGRLKPKEAAAISLNMSLGYSHAEVAAIMNLPLGSIKSHINRGLAKLRILLEQEEEAP